jgi:hypothetical protein
MRQGGKRAALHNPHDAGSNYQISCLQSPLSAEKIDTVKTHNTLSLPLVMPVSVDVYPLKADVFLFLYPFLFSISRRDDT